MPIADRIVIKDGVVFRDPTGANTAYGGVISSAVIKLAKKDLDGSAWTDKADRHLKGTGNHSVTWTFRPSASMSTHVQTLMNDFAVDATVTWEVRFKSSAAAPDNLRYRFDVLVVEVPMGGNRGDVLDINVTWPIDGQVSVFDGTTTTLL